MPAIDRQCENCLRSFKTEKKYVDRGQGRYCSLTCSGEHRSKNHSPVVHPPNVVCAFCKSPFYKSPSKKANSKSGLFFCTRAHKDAAQRIGGIKEIMPPHYGISSNRKQAMQAARKPYCERCGYDTVPEILHVHHMDCDRNNNTPENLICLCPNCHHEEHWKTKTGLFFLR